MFERNQADFIKQTVRNMTQNSRVGKVVQVYEHIEDDDDSNFEADVNFPEEEDLEHRVTPISNPGVGSIDVPRVGDKVIVEYLHGDKTNPVITRHVDTNQDRAVKGLAGMYRSRFDSDGRESPAGDGDLYLTGATYYDKNPAITDYRDLTPHRSFVRIAKKGDAMNEESLPMSIEMYDDPEEGDAWVKLEANKVGGVDSDVPYGVKINLNDGSIKLLDAGGYGITSDGSGNLELYYETKTENQGQSTSL